MLRPLHDILAELQESRAVVVDRPATGNVLHAVWRAAESEAGAAYDRWREQGGREPYAAYRAAADRADAALDALREAA